MQCDRCSNPHKYRTFAKIVDGKPTIMGEIECDHCSGFADAKESKCKGFQPKEVI